MVPQALRNQSRSVGLQVGHVMAVIVLLGRRDHGSKMTRQIFQENGKEMTFAPAGKR